MASKTKVEILNIRFDPKLSAAITAYMEAQGNPELKRSAAIRALIRKGLS